MLFLHVGACLREPRKPSQKEQTKSSHTRYCKVLAVALAFGFAVAKSEDARSLLCTFWTLKTLQYYRPNGFKGSLLQRCNGVNSFVKKGVCAYKCIQFLHAPMCQGTSTPWRVHVGSGQV